MYATTKTRQHPPKDRPPRARDRSRPRWAVLGLCLVLGAVGANGAAAAGHPGAAPARCDRVPTGVTAEDHWLDFTVPPGLMPDPQFNGRPARIQVHRVRPSYANGKCPGGGPVRAAVLIHGRTVPGPAQFDLQHPAPDGGALSVQTALAQEGIDTFAPNLLGYGLSTRFEDGLDDVGNASLRAFETDGNCSHPEGCDRTHNPTVFPLDQQGSLLVANPLGGERRAHSSSTRFARTDVWVRDIRQVVDDAVARARPTGGRLTLIGHSLGGVHVARALYPGNTVVPGAAVTLRKVNRVVFMSSPFGFPTEEVAPPGGFSTFPLTLSTRAGLGQTPVPAARDLVCTGRTVPGAADALRDQVFAQDPIGSTWGGTVPGNPTGLSRTPTFSTYGWNSEVAGQLAPPALVIHGLDDTQSVPADASAIYDALPATMTNKALVHVGCASNGMMHEACTGARCTPQSGTVYGGRPGEPWAGPHATVKTALTEWIQRGTFNGAATGRFLVDDSGVANPA